jgi:hypothetical protein
MSWLQNKKTGVLAKTQEHVPASDGDNEAIVSVG